MQITSTRRHFCAAALAVLCCTQAAFAQADKKSSAGAEGGNWPQWRGPQRDNLSTETGLLKEWPSGGPKLLWKAEKLGKGFSSVSVADGKIFSMGDADDGSYVFALSEADGKPLWATKIGKPGEYGGYAGTRATPSYDAGFVYALNQHGDLVCLDAKTGKPKWGHNLTAEFKGTRPGWGYAESPLVDGDLVVCTPGGAQGTMMAFSKKTGRPAWRTQGWKDGAHYVSAIVEEVGGVRQFIQMTDKNVAGIEAKTGKVLWLAPRTGQTAVIPTPIYKDKMVWVTSGYGVGCNLFEIGSQGKQFAARQAYANKDLANHHGGVVLISDHIYGTEDLMLICMEMKSGKVAWKDRSVGKGAIAFADGMLYVRAEGDGKVALVEATPEGYKEKGMLEQPDRSDAQAWPQPVIAGGRLYLRDQDILLCYDLKGQ